jgi:hypothetical protein
MLTGIRQLTTFTSLISNRFGLIAGQKDILQKILEWLIGKGPNTLFLTLREVNFTQIKIVKRYHMF